MWILNIFITVGSSDGTAFKEENQYLLRSDSEIGSMFDLYFPLTLGSSLRELRSLVQITKLVQNRAETATSFS